MSTDWGFACKQCKNEDGQPIAETWFNRRPELVPLCYKAWPHVKAIRDLDTYDDGDIFVGVSYDEDPDVWDFLEKHYDHGLWKADEYGRIYNIDDNPYKDKPVGGEDK